MKILWDSSSDINTMKKTYKSYENAVKAAQKILGDNNIRVVIAATPEGRFFPVAIGQEALMSGAHFHMAVTG